MQNKLQENIDFGQAVAVKSSWFVPLHRDELISMLASGIIVPGNGEESREATLQHIFDNSILLARGGLPSSVLDTPGLVGSRGYTVLVEIDTNGFPDVRADGLSLDGIGCESSLVEEAAEAYLLSVPAVLSVNDIRAIHFRSESDKLNFVARGFDNVPSDIVPMQVSENLFILDITWIDASVLEDFARSSSVKFPVELYSQSDYFCGCLALMGLSLPSKENWFHLAKNILTSTECNIVSQMVGLGLVHDELEQILLGSAYDLMSRMDPTEGWQPKKVLSDLYDVVTEHGLTDNDTKRLDKWKITCELILDNKRSVTPLSDEKMKVGRALLLLLLRPDPEDVLNSKGSLLAPGPEVFLLAAILSGARYGFEELPVSIKTDKFGYAYYADLRTNIINSGWNDSLFQENIRTPEVELEISDWGIVGQEYRLMVGGHEIVVAQDEGSLELRHVLVQAESAGIDLVFDRSTNRLKFDKKLPDERSQTVFVDAGDLNSEGEPTIRFWSPCLDLSTSKGRRLLTKKMSLELLQHNCESNLHCRFGICGKEEAIVVISDQIVQTMDRKELVSGLEHVAITADTLEKKLGLDHY